MFEISLKLIRYFELIENNILKWESGQNIEIPINVNIKTKYDFYKKEIEDNFIKYKKEIEKNFNDIYSGNDKTEEIKKNIKILLTNIESLFNSFLKEINQEAKKLDKILFKLKRNNIPMLFNYKKFLPLSLKFGALYSISFMIIFGASTELVAEGGLLLSLGITSFVAGGAIGFGVGGVLAALSLLTSYYLTKLIGKIFNKKKMKVYHDEIMNRLEAIQFKVNEDMDLFYNSIKNKIDEDKMSIKEPMENFIKNKSNRKLFFELKENFIKFLLMLNKINDK